MSTLKPGQTSSAIARLRDAAIKEMDAPPAGESKPGFPEFDASHKASRNDAETSYDDDNWVARYAGPNCPHIGNGSGGVI